MKRGHGYIGRYVLDANGDPVLCDGDENLEKWGRFLKDVGARTIAKDKDESGGSTIEVSTVFLALDHQFGDGPPVLWKTLIFGGVLDGQMQRYTSREAALLGHQEWCRRVAATLPPRPVSERDGLL